LAKNPLNIIVKIMFDLYLVTDESLSLGRSVEWVVEQAVQGGLTMVQLREKALNTRLFVERAEKIKKILAPKRIPLIINDRLDVALAAGADGIHIGQHDMPYEKAKSLLPEGSMIGLSVETMEQVREAEKMDVDYLGVSPIFSTSTKTDVETQWGIEGLKKVRAFSRHKLVAIGRMKASNAAEVIKAGADGIAVVSAICSAPDPKNAAVQLMDEISKAKYSAR